MIAGLPVTADLNLLHADFSKRFLALIALTILVAGCGDDSDDGSGAAATSSASISTGGGTSGGTGGGSGGGSTVTLTISGTPPTQLLQDTAFSFTPTVSNPDNVTLTFTAANLPSWASINASTGEVSGTPGGGDIGVYSNITITVTGGGTSATSPPWTVEVVAVASGSATLSWEAPTENTDGSALTDLAGFKVYWGQSPSNLDSSVILGTSSLTYMVDQLTPATWYFAVTAYDLEDNESALSNIASKTVL